MAEDKQALEQKTGSQEEVTIIKTSSPKAAWWVYTTYFAEGLPFTVVRILSTMFFTDIGIKERYLGYLNFFSIPWTLKFIWAPFLDLFSTKRNWLIILQFLFSFMMMAIAGLCYLAYIVPPLSTFEEFTAFGYQLPELFPYLKLIPIAIACAFVVLAFISATNDIAIDAYYLEGFREPSQQAAYSGDRVTAYRLALIFGRSGIVALVAYMAYSLQLAGKDSPASKSWAYGFGAVSLTMLLVAFFHLFKLPHFENKREGTFKVKETFNSFIQAFVSYLQQEKILLVLIFIILYKIGDEILFSMNTPFLRREIKLSNAQLSWIAGIVGAAGAVLGAMSGAWWIKKQGLRKAIWPLTLLMNLNIWAYTWLAYAKPNPATTKGISLIAFVYFYEQVASGLGSAALTIFLMRLCKAEFKAAHYAIGTAIMIIPGAIVGGFSGTLVEKYGYVNLFIVAFLSTIPSMILMFFVPIRDEIKK